MSQTRNKKNFGTRPSNPKPTFADFKDFPSIAWNLTEDFTPVPCSCLSVSDDSATLEKTQSLGIRNVMVLSIPRKLSFVHRLCLLKLSRQIEAIQLNENQFHILNKQLKLSEEKVFVYVIEQRHSLNLAAVWRIFMSCETAELPLLITKESGSSQWPKNLFEHYLRVDGGRAIVLFLDDTFPTIMDEVSDKDQVVLVPVSIGWELPDSRGKQTARVNFGYPVSWSEFDQKCDGLPYKPGVTRYVFQHLRHDIFRNRPIMCTSLHSLISHFAQCPDIEVHDKFEDLLHIIRNRKRDIGFIGKTEDILNYSRIRVKLNRNKNAIYEAARNATEPFLLDAVFITSLYCLIGDSAACEDEPKIVENELLEAAAELGELFRFEAELFPPCQENTKKFTKTLEHFVHVGLLSYKKEEEMLETKENRRARRIAREFEFNLYENEEMEIFQPVREVVLYVNQSVLEQLSWMRRIWAPVIDSYYVTARELLVLVGKDVMEEADFVDHVIKVIRSQVEDGLVEFEESSSETFVENAVRFFTDIGVLETYSHSGILVVYVKPDHMEENAIYDLIAQIAKFRLF